MEEQEDAWVVFMATGCALTVVGLLLLDAADWFVRLPVLGAGLVLTTYAALRAAGNDPSFEER